MAKYTALMMVALLALAGANASRELKGLLDPVTGAAGGLLGASVGNGANGVANGGQGNGVIVKDNNNQENNGNAEQTTVCKKSCNGAISVGCCATIGNIGNNNNIKVVEFCNASPGQCCVLPSIKDVTAGVTGIGGTVPIDITEVTQNTALALLGSAVQNGNIQRCA